jgi:hypothetical protein
MKWFADLAELRFGSEREVEMHFVSPLFEQLGYRQDQEGAGFGFVMWEGVRQHHAEADLLYFAGDVHDVDKGDPQGAAVPDQRACEARRVTLREKFDDLYGVLNPEAALATRQQ